MPAAWPKKVQVQARACKESKYHYVSKTHQFLLTDKQRTRTSTGGLVLRLRRTRALAGMSRSQKSPWLRSKPFTKHIKIMEAWASSTRVLAGMSCSQSSRRLRIRQQTTSMVAEWVSGTSALAGMSCSQSSPWLHSIPSTNNIKLLVVWLRCLLACRTLHTISVLNSWEVHAILAEIRARTAAKLAQRHSESEADTHDPRSGFVPIPPARTLQVGSCKLGCANLR